MGHARALLLSSSSCHGFGLMEFAKQEVCRFLAGINEIVFIPYALNDFNAYTEKIKQVMEPWGIKVNGIHTFSDPIAAITSNKAVYIGGGNTFLLLKRLYENGLVDLIHQRVFNGELLYMGSSAGTNVATKGIHTTNDMPIVYPPSFDGIKLVPFNINPHYIDKVENETHKGETREQRIKEYLEIDNDAQVLGLREGSLLHVDGDSLSIKGVTGAVLFKKDLKEEYPAGSDVSFLLNK